MQFRILGPLEVRSDGTVLTVSGPVQRRLLALLVLQVNQRLSGDFLASCLWPTQFSDRGASSVQVHVSRLRKLLPGLPLRTETGGYRLSVSEDDVDLLLFERLVAAAELARRAGDAAAAVEQFDGALALWRGDVLDGEIADTAPYVGPVIGRLRERRTSAVEQRAECLLELGKDDEALRQLQAAADANPLRERLQALLMTALYRSGRQSDALAAYRHIRRMLRDELGVDPSPDLRDLEHAILRHDPALQSQAPRPLPPVEVAFPGPLADTTENTDVATGSDDTNGRGRRRLGVLAAALIALPVAAATALAMVHPSAGSTPAPSSSDPSRPATAARVVPHHSTSYRGLQPQASRLITLGCEAGRQDATINGTQNSIVLLEFGGGSRLRLDAIERSASAFEDGYLRCLTLDRNDGSHVRVAITADMTGQEAVDRRTMFDRGRAWYALVQRLNDRTHGKGTWSNIDFAAGMDFRPGDGATRAAVRAWVDGYAQAAPNKGQLTAVVNATTAGYLYFHGTSGVCGAVTPTLGADCGHGWTIDDIAYIAWQAGPVMALPVIDTPGDADWWAELSRTLAATSGKIEFSGAACACPASGWQPAQAWTALRDELNRPGDPARWSPRWITSIVSG